MTISTMRTSSGLLGSRILRTGTINARVAGVDPRVRGALRELDDLLATPLFNSQDEPAEAAPAGAAPAEQIAPAEAAAPVGGGGLPLSVLERPLQPRRPGDRDEWEAGTLGRELDAMRARVARAPIPDLVSLAAIIADDSELSQFSDQFDALLDERLWDLPLNFRVVLAPEYPAIRAYLLMLGVTAKRIGTPSGLVSFVVRNGDGAARIVDYAAISAARDWIKSENLNIDYRSDDHEVIKDLRAANLSLAEDSFLPGVKAVVGRALSDSGLGKLVDSHRSLFPPSFRASLIEYLKRAPVRIDASNVESYIPLYVQQIAGGIDFSQPSSAASWEVSDQDFTVDFFTEDKELVEVSRSSVKAAAQLYYTMVLGDELQMFDVVNFFTHKYLVNRSFEIRDPKLRRDLQMYVFSNQFPVTDRLSRATRLVERTRPAERRMFYRQVFNQGGGEITEDVIINDEYSRLWKVLMLESAKYLERIQISPNPDTRVSRQNIMQAVEDLQYNLSIHCTGMATVMTPLIYDELSFVTRGILMHEEVRRQVAPSGGSWWKVVENLYEGMNHIRPRATALNNKARLAHSIISRIADYDPVPFEQDTNFFPFISDVEAFITTQSILQEHLRDALRPDAIDTDEIADEAGPILPPASGGEAAAPSSPPSGEWDF